MSAHVVEDKTINRIVSYLYDDIHFETSVLRDQFRKVLEGIGYSPEAEDFCSKLGKAMFDLNVRSVDARYGKGEAEKLRAEALKPLNYDFKKVKPGTIFQILKSLNCWLYQCSTGNCPEDPIYKAFEHISNIISAYIVVNLPEYKNAKWC